MRGGGEIGDRIVLRAIRFFGEGWGEVKSEGGGAFFMRLNIVF